MKTSLSLQGQAVVLEPATSADNILQPLIDATTPLTIRQHSATQSAALQRFEDSLGNLLSSVDASGAFTGAAASPSGAVILAPATAGRNTIQPTVDTAEGLVIKGHSATQSARLLRVTDHAATGSLLSVREPNTGAGFSVSAANLATGDVALIVTNNVNGDNTPVQTITNLDAGGNPQTVSFEAGTSAPTSPIAMVTYLPDAAGTQVPAAGWEPTLRVNTAGATRGEVNIRVHDHAGTSIALQASGDGSANPQIGFLGATAVSRQTNGTAANLAAIADAPAKAFVTALSTALVNLGLLAAPA